MPFVELPGVDLWYNDTGRETETPVIFMHAASGTSDSWVHQVPVFTQAGYALRPNTECTVSTGFRALMKN